MADVHQPGTAERSPWFPGGDERLHPVVLADALALPRTTWWRMV